MNVRSNEPEMAKLYRLRTLEWWQRQALVTLRPITTTQGLTVGAGTEVRVVTKRNGFTVETPRCAHCGVRFNVGRVPATAFAAGYPVD